MYDVLPGRELLELQSLNTELACTKLDTIVKSYKPYLPQLGAPGVSAIRLTKATGFSIFLQGLFLQVIFRLIGEGKKAMPI
jgi:hypothetical protein